MDRLYYLTFTVPANTAIGSPVSLAWPLEDAKLRDIQILVPPGPSGLSGFRLTWAQQQIVPWGNNSFLVSDNEVIKVDCDIDMTATGLVAQGYNTDIFNHTYYFRGTIQDLPLPLTTVATETSNAFTVPSDLLNQQFSGIDNLTAVPLQPVGTVSPVKHVPPSFVPPRIARLHPHYIFPSGPTEKVPHEHPHHERKRG